MNSSYASAAAAAIMLFKVTAANASPNDGEVANCYATMLNIHSINDQLRTKPGAPQLDPELVSVADDAAKTLYFALASRGLYDFNKIIRETELGWERQFTVGTTKNAVAALDDAGRKCVITAFQVRHELRK